MLIAGLSNQTTLGVRPSKEVKEVRCPTTGARLPHGMRDGSQFSGSLVACGLVSTIVGK
jgi:hypothetical protein